MGWSDPDLPLQTLMRGRYIRDPDKLPPEAGCYILDIRLEAEFPLRRPSRFATGAGGWPESLGPGCYFYCGSASGPGGLRARVGRHFNPIKSVRWHIDQLTVGGRVAGALVFEKASHPALSECILAAMLQAPSIGATVSLDGFGSSDCRGCPSHLVRHQHSLLSLFA